MNSPVEKILVISESGTMTELALLENKKLIEYHQDIPQNQYKVGDFYIGKIKKIIPGLNSAFIDVGYEKDGFLHYYDLGPNFKSVLRFINSSLQSPQRNIDISKVKLEPEIVKAGKIADVITTKKNILVQILKEPISAKGPRLTCDFTIPGRFLVLTPFGNTIAISKKIESNEERKRLQKILESVKLRNFGVIARTAAIGKNASEIHKELQSLVEVWDNIQKQVKTVSIPSRILNKDKKNTGIIPNMLNNSYNKIVVNDKKIADFIKDYLKSISPGKESIVSLFSKQHSVFEYFGITRQLKVLFSKKINLASGAYLIVESTEALHVIDVNSGNRSSNESSQEENALKTNLEAAAEIARILKLRDLGGIIVIDFIDMKLLENKKNIFQALRKAMNTDKARHTILPPSKFNLVQITRQRVRPETQLNIQEICPTCKGTGEIATPYQVEEEVLKKLEMVATHNKGKIYIAVHPIFYSYFTKGLFSLVWKWNWKFKRKIKIIPSKDFSFLEYKFFNKSMDEIIV